jgi:heat shock protein HslJ
VTDLDGSWVVESIRVGAELTPPSSELTLEIDGDRVTGKALNRIVGTLGVDKVFGNMAATRMAGPPEIMEEERLFLQCLSAVDEVVPSRLVLLSAGSTLLVLRREPDEGE